MMNTATDSNAMSLWGQFRNLSRRVRAAPPALVDAPRRTQLDFAVPNPWGGAPLCRASVAVTASRHARGESLRVQAQFDGWWRRGSESQPRTALAASQPRGSGLVGYGRKAAGALLREGITRLPLPAGEHRLRTWVDVRASTEPLANGAASLLPERVRQLCGPLQAAAPGEPRVGVWMDRGAGPDGGSAQLALLQFDDRDLPAGTVSGPFNFSASVATVTDPVRRDPADDRTP